MNECIICVGANSEHRSRNLVRATEFLARSGIITDRSGMFSSEPERCQNQPLYLNEVLRFSTGLSFEELHAGIKAYESRERSAHKSPTVCIDIDIVYWNGACLRPLDAKSNYFLTGMQKMASMCKVP